MMSEVRRDRLAKLFGILRFAVLAAVAIPASLAAHAQTFTLPPPEIVPTFLGIDLPLRPGERLAPIGKGDCSAVVFAPHEERYQSHAKFWSGVEWIGPCRFGLAHGNGALSLSDGRVVDKQMLYGLEMFEPRQVRTQPVLYGDGSSGDVTTQQLNYFRTDTFSSLSTNRLSIIGYEFIQNVKSLTEVESLWFWKSEVQIYAFDASGHESTMSVYEKNPSCGPDVPEDLKAFAKEIRKACKQKPAGQRILIRREGPAHLPTGQHKTIALAACPFDKSTGFVECDVVLRGVLGKKYATEVEAIMAGDRAARLAASQEVFARYAPLEQAVEARLAARSSGLNAGGFQ